MTTASRLPDRVTLCVKHILPVVGAPLALIGVFRGAKP